MFKTYYPGSQFSPRWGRGLRYKRTVVLLRGRASIYKLQAAGFNLQLAEPCAMSTPTGLTLPTVGPVRAGVVFGRPIP
jgi:hypothetical protein